MDFPDLLPTELPICRVPKLRWSLPFRDFFRDLRSSPRVPSRWMALIQSHDFGTSDAPEVLSSGSAKRRTPIRRVDFSIGTFSDSLDLCHVSPQTDGSDSLSLFRDLKCPDFLDLENSDIPNVDIPISQSFRDFHPLVHEAFTPCNSRQI
jgi:hypothetical protein